MWGVGCDPYLFLGKPEDVEVLIVDAVPPYTLHPTPCTLHHAYLHRQARKPHVICTMEPHVTCSHVTYTTRRASWEVRGARIVAAVCHHGRCQLPKEMLTSASALPSLSPQTSGEASHNLY